MIRRMLIFRILILAISMLVSIPSLAKDKFILSENSRLKLIEVGEKHGDMATFSGKEIVEGEFIIGWKFIDEQPYQLEARLYPINESKLNLPYEEGGVPIGELYLSTPEKAAQLLLPEDQARKILNRELVTAKGTATIEISGYTTAIDCDRRWYMADIVRVSSSIKAATTSTTEYSYGC